MYKVYFDKRFIVISSQPDRMQKYFLFHKYHDIDELYVKISAFLNNNDISSFNIYSYKIDSLWNAFRGFFENRIASGGLLQNDNGELLFIRRRGKWDIPKGHLSENESVRECAVREIEEETGLRAGTARLILKPTYHIYRIKEKWILKETHWYVFEDTGEGKPKPQQSEDITELKWFNRDEIKYIHQNTWPSVSDVVHEVVRNLQNNQAL